MEKIGEHPSYYVLIATVSGILLLGSGALIVGTQSRANPNDQPLPTIVQIPDYKGNQGFPTTSPIGGRAKDSSLTTTVDATLTPAASITATPTPNLVASWSAYTSSYGYSIKYPPDWTATKTTSGDPLIVEYVLFNPSSVSTSSSSITVSYSNRTYSQALAVYNANAQTISIGTISAGMQTVSDSNRNVAYRVVIADGSANSIAVFSRQAYQNIFNLMIGSFKLL